MLLEIQNKLGSIEANITQIKEDIKELKTNDKNFDISLSTRQDTLRNNMQEQIDALNIRVNDLEQVKGKTLIKWYDKVIDKIVYAFLIAALLMLLRWLQIPGEMIQQLGG